MSKRSVLDLIEEDAAVKSGNGGNEEVLSTLGHNPLSRKRQVLGCVLRIGSTHDTSTRITSSLTNDRVESGDLVCGLAEGEPSVVRPS